MTVIFGTVNFRVRPEAVAELVQDALDAGMAPSEVLNGALLAGMDEVGRDFKAGVLFVPEVMFAARAMKAGMSVLRPLLAESEIASSGKCVLGTVKGDLHDIGKNLVTMMLDGGALRPSIWELTWSRALLLTLSASTSPIWLE